VDNLLFHTNGKCDCGGHCFVNAVYSELSNTGEWHIMIEEWCPDCHTLDVTDISWEQVTGDSKHVEAARAAGQHDQDRESERAEAEESGIPDFDDMGFIRGYIPRSDPSEM
jgi:hypothetical protein